MIAKVQAQAARAEAKAAARAARNQRSATDTLAALTASRTGKSKRARAEQQRMLLAELTKAKASENNGHDYALDARRRKREDKPKFMHYNKGSDFGTRTATAGTKTGASINSYFAAKGRIPK